ncbi:unnamed protein product [Allacma fusca]|uniref:J domain-containing protein n=1 Tax=Allacma fusca TaxID=39272 RepID=A0A8J2JHE3_9HEXA|nr:unnamed protein product [Allacma fusca]
MWSGLNFSSKQTDPNYYQILGCCENATVEQITTEYRIRALKHHPDKNPGSEKALQEFQKLQEARDTLADHSKRKVYDEWRKSGVGITYQQWKNINDRCQMTMHWATPKKSTMLEGKGVEDPFRNDEWHPDQISTCLLPEINRINLLVGRRWWDKLLRSCGTWAVGSGIM